MEVRSESENSAVCNVMMLMTKQYLHYSGIDDGGEKQTHGNEVNKNGPFDVSLHLAGPSSRSSDWNQAGKIFNS
jgi:hypothetical protein